MENKMEQSISCAERLSINMRFKIETAPTNCNYVLVDPETKEIVIANRNSFGYNLIAGYDPEFDSKYGRNMKKNQNKGNYRNFSYSEKSMNEVGFKLVTRGEIALW